MKKYILPLIAVATFCYSNSAVSSQRINNWTGFYLGANAGYWKSQTDDLTTTGSVSFINPTFPSGSGNIANALAQFATNSFSLHPDGFIGGGQAGYNYQFSRGILLGLNTDFAGLSNANNTYNLQKSVNLTDFDESYTGSLSVKQKINYLGTVRGRLGYVFCPTFLVYVTGGFAYGNVTLDTSWTAQESLGAEVFPSIATKSNVSKTLAGWTAGAGIEWLFRPNWGASLEYTFYALNGRLSASTSLAQTNASLSPAVLWGSAAVKTALSSLEVGTIRLGVNYHFA